MNDALTSEKVLALPVTQEQYDQVSLNRKSTFINIYNDKGEYSHSVNSLDMKDGQDYLFLAEVLRAAELAGKSPLNSLAIYRGIVFRLSAVQTSELQTGLKMNTARKEDWKRQAQPAPAPTAQNQPIQQAVF